MAAIGKSFLVTLLVSVLALQLVEVHSQCDDRVECHSQQDCCENQGCFKLVDSCSGKQKGLCYPQQRGGWTKPCIEGSPCKRLGDCCDFQECLGEPGSKSCHPPRTKLI